MKLNVISQNLTHRAPAQPRSVHESVRKRKLAAFAAAGFHLRAAALVLPDRELFARQAQQYATDGKSVDELTMAEMRGASGTVSWPSTVVALVWVAKHGGLKSR